LQGQADENTGNGSEPHVELIHKAGSRMQAIEFLGPRFAWGSDEFEQWFVDELVVCYGDQQGGSGQSCGCSTAMPALTSGEQDTEQ